MTKIASSSRRVSVYNSRKYLFICILAVLSLLGIGGGVRAQDYCYVFYNSSNGVYLCVNNSSLDVTSTFSPNNCIWQASGTLGNNTSRSVHSYTSDYSSRYLYVENYYYGGVTLSSEQARWRLNNEYLCYYYNRGYYNTYRHYITTDGSSVSTSTSSSTSGFKAYAVTITSYDETITNPTITGSSTIALNTTSEDYDASGAAYQRGYTNYSFTIGSTTYNYYYDDNGSSFTGTPSASTISGYTWSLSNTDYASVNSEGLVTVTNRPTVDTEVTLYATATVTGGVPAAPANTTLIAQKTITILGTTPNPPTITSSRVTVTITSTNNSDIIYYTTDGSTPSSSSTQYSDAFTITGTTTIKAIACRNGNCSSPSTLVVTPGTCVSGTMVILNDFEDHTWSYYQDNNDLPTGYPTGYLNSPDPRNVIIDYRGVDLEGNLSANVAISGLTGENQNEMIYYKTLEKTVLGMTGDYPYTVISNPFSKRPKSGSTYYGFAGWKVKSGGEYIAEYSNNDVIPLDATIHFTNLNTNYSPNCISATVVLEATWTEATVKTGTSAQTFSGGTYETNFWLVNGNINSDVTVNSPCTVTMMSPDGGATVNNRGNYTISRSINPGTDHVKVEFVRMNHTNAVNINGYDYIIGRGVIGVNNSYTGGDIQGCSSNKECTHTFKIESGTYSSLHNFTSNINTNRIIDQLMILGCDYDRAKGDNSKLIIKGDMYGGYEIQLNRTSNDLYLRGVIKSGTFQSNVTVGGNGNYKGSGGTQSYYFSVASIHNAGRRFLTVEGGRLAGIAGGMDETNNQDTTARSFDLRVRGTAQIDGVVYGAAEYANGKGTRVMVFTGGTINGWIAGGANGTQVSDGALRGSAYLYVGGKTQVVNDDDYPNQVMNRGVGGNVFGAGCGYSTTSTSGQVTLGTNVVVSDEAVVDRGVYGGGSFGYCTINQTANVFILGGKVNGKDGGVNGTNYSSSIQGGVFGGACQNKGGEVNILMTDGTVMGGVYGGSNSSGTIAENAVVTVYGGTVGSQSDSANVHGGGLGSSTYITKNVTVTIGKDCDNGPMIYGDVHGGSAQGTVNGTEDSHAYTNNYTTSVSVAGGTMHDVFGGGLGTNSIAATVCGRVTVNVTGGIISNVFGGNNVNGQPLGSSIVTINYAEGCGTTSCGNSVNYAIKEAVYGGGRGAAYDYTGGTVVNFQNGSAAAVYGGGLGANASVKKTTVTMTGGTVGNVFGGGNAGPVGTEGTAASVVSTTVSVLNGTVCNNVYGGGNAATVNGSTRVNIGEECISN